MKSYSRSNCSQTFRSSVICPLYLVTSYFNLLDSKAKPKSNSLIFHYWALSQLIEPPRKTSYSSLSLIQKAKSFLLILVFPPELCLHLVHRHHLRHMSTLLYTWTLRLHVVHYVYSIGIVKDPISGFGLSNSIGVTACSRLEFDFIWRRCWPRIPFVLIFNFLALLSELFWYEKIRKLGFIEMTID